MRNVFSTFLLICTAILYVYHLGVLPPPTIPDGSRAAATPPSFFISRLAPLPDEGVHRQNAGQPASRAPGPVSGMNHLILHGNAYQRGKVAGELTADLLRAQEKELVGLLRTWIPWTPVLEGLVLVGILWFDGIQKYFSRWQTDEMYGVSQSAPPEFNYLIDPFTRQLSYHGLHEVGQLLVDQGREDMGCTVFAVPDERSWLVGRNFDFEAGRIFDREKILKWVFPDEGYKYVSVIWAGMVGAVTGVNEHGIYISMNAAGSRDFRRLGTPSTLVLLQVLQFARSGDEALAILRNASMFITDIFVVVDARAGRAFRVEKSPLRTVVLPLEKPAVITNHLLGSEFQTDSINIFRRDELTSGARATRGETLIRSWSKGGGDPHENNLRMLGWLRDKAQADGGPLPLGNRRAIDALIATHAVIYDGGREIFYVGQGPGVSGRFTGYDLRASFRTARPILSDYLPADPNVSAADFEEVHLAAQAVARAQKEVNHREFGQALVTLDSIAPNRREFSEYYLTRGNALLGQRDRAAAREAWTHARELRPAYARTARELEEKLK